MHKIKVLFLAANPIDTRRLRLDVEIREIAEKVRAADHRDSLELISWWAVRPDDLLQALNQHRPHIVHFSGHGSEIDGILLENNKGIAQAVSKEALRSLFRTLADNIRLVVLNACFTQVQAEAITEIVDCAVGTNKSLSDRAAITFAASFYRAIGFGRSVQEAFDQGKTSLMLESLPGEGIVRLLTRSAVDASNLILVADHANPSRPLDIGRDHLSIDRFYEKGK